MSRDPRTHLSGAPSALAFDDGLRALAALARDEGDDAARAAVAQAEELVSAWPASARVAPRWLLESWTAGARPRFGALVRALEVGRGVGERRPVDVTQVLTRAPLTRLHAIRLTAANSNATDELAESLETLSEGPLRALTLRECQISSRAHGLLATSRALSGLEALALPRTIASAEHVACWTQAQAWGGLKSLDLSDNALGLTGASRLAAAPEAELEHLALASCGLDVEALRAILGSAASPKLRTLELGRNAWSRSCWEALQRAPLDALERLNLDGTALGAELEGASALGWRAPVRALSIRSARLDPTHVAPLCRVLPRSPRELDVAGNHLDARAAAALLEGLGAGSLEVLSLSRNPVSNEGVARVLGALEGAPLRRLGLSSSARWRAERTAEGARVALDALERLPAFGALEALDLSGRFGAPEDTAWLAAALPGGLEELALRDCRVDDEGFEALARRGASLRVLDVSENAALSVDAILRALHAGAWPKLEVLRASLIGASCSEPRVRKALEVVCRRRRVSLERGEVSEVGPLDVARWSWLMAPASYSRLQFFDRPRDGLYWF